MDAQVAFRRKARIRGYSRLEALMGSMGGAENYKVGGKVLEALSEFGASSDYKQFFAEALQCEHDINTESYKLMGRLRPKDTDDPMIPPGVLLKAIQEMTKNFNTWRSQADFLYQRGQDIHPLQIDTGKMSRSTSLKALCSVETKHVHYAEGDDLHIQEGTKPNQVKVRTDTGEEGLVPALACILPSPDRSARPASERLCVQLLATWTECVRKARSALRGTLKGTAETLIDEWTDPNAQGSQIGRERVVRRIRRVTDILNGQTPRTDYSKLHNALFSLEKELMSWAENGTNVGPTITLVSDLDKCVLCYQMLRKHWSMYSHSLTTLSRPIRVTEHWSKFKPVRKGKKLKYLEMKTTLEATETVEEITRTKPNEEWKSEVSSSGRKVEADEIVSSRQEAKTRFVIQGVLDPRTNAEISIQEACNQGIVDYSTGMYCNPLTMDRIPIPVAMSQNMIRVEAQTSDKSKEETTGIGMISIKKRIDDRTYHITQVIDEDTGKKISQDQAIKLGILDKDCATYKHTVSGESMPIIDAIEAGWVIAEYDDNSKGPQYETKRYAVSAVVDQRRKIRVPFHEAVQLGLIERDTGNYINNVTGEKVFVADALEKGFLKAKVMGEREAKSLDIDAENKIVVERMDKMRKNVLKSMGVINALRKAAGSEVNGNSLPNGNHDNNNN